MCPQYLCLILCGDLIQPGAGLDLSLGISINYKAFTYMPNSSSINEYFDKVWIHAVISSFSVTNKAKRGGFNLWPDL